jgi:hypothetical protein
MGNRPEGLIRKAEEDNLWLIGVLFFSRGSAVHGNCETDITGSVLKHNWLPLLCRLNAVNNATIPAHDDRS